MCLRPKALRPTLSDSLPLSAVIKDFFLFVIFQTKKAGSLAVLTQNVS
jgi:hypothetical protein